MTFVRAAAMGRHFAFKRAPISLLRANNWAAPAAGSRFLSSVKIPAAPTSNHPHTPLANATGSIVYTETDEAPALATFSLYPYIAKESVDLLGDVDTNALEVGLFFTNTKRHCHYLCCL